MSSLTQPHEKENLIDAEKHASAKITTTLKALTRKQIFKIIITSLAALYVMILLLVSSSLQQDSKIFAGSPKDNDIPNISNTTHTELVPIWRQFFSLSATVSIGIMGGKLAEMNKQSAMLGMLFTGVLLRNVFPTIIIQLPHEWTSKLWSLALTSVIARAGLYLEINVLSKNSISTIALGSIPVLAETFFTAFVSSFVFKLPLSWAFTLGFGTSCMSPGVVVPLVLNLVESGWKQSRIPPIALAGLSIDVLIATVGFGISLSSSFGHNHESEGWMHDSWIMRGLEEVTGGIILGAFIGGLGLILLKIKSVEPLVSGVIFSCSSVIMTVAKTAGFTGAGTCATFLTWLIVANTWSKGDISLVESRYINLYQD